MLFPKIFLRSFRLLLFPVSLLYGIGIFLRNWMYDKNILRSASFGLPLISVGNLAVGGTGKSPFVQYLVNRIGDPKTLAVLSRGYKRRSKGYRLAQPDSTVAELGDEALLLYQRYPDLSVAVCEQRLLAIPQLLQDRPNVNCILLDDAHQHRSIHPGFHILLTDYQNLFTRDFFMPTGDLRDERRSYRRADVIVVTKCPATTTVQEAAAIRQEIDPLPHQQVFFTSQVLEKPRQWHKPQYSRSPLKQEVLLVTGIANPTILKSWMEEETASYHFLPFPDHHLFNINDIREIRDQYRKLQNPDAWILTTAKDAVRLLPFAQEMQDLPVYVTDYEHQFLFEEEIIFQQRIQHFLSQQKIRAHG
ncbi:MAG: tetraacyldisaccharide 4'-kinase [Bacteroidetes bacterium]|nr:tetraacyldisaccharide 4'-kinase [Bacteroidota bacterium]